MVGNQAIRMRDVRKVTDPLLMKNDQKLASSKTPDLLAAASIPQTEVSRDEGAPEASRTTDDLMNSVDILQV